MLFVSKRCDQQGSVEIEHSKPFVVAHATNKLGRTLALWRHRIGYRAQHHRIDAMALTGSWEELGHGLAPPHNADRLPGGGGGHQLAKVSLGLG